MIIQSNRVWIAGQFMAAQVEVEDEFAPIKDFTGPHNPEVAKELYEKKHEILKMTH